MVYSNSQLGSIIPPYKLHRTRVLVTIQIMFFKFQCPNEGLEYNIPSPNTQKNETSNGDMSTPYIMWPPFLSTLYSTKMYQMKIYNEVWLVVSTHLKNISQNGNPPQVGVKIKTFKSTT